MFLFSLLALASADTVDFQRNTAATLGDGQHSVGVFAPFRYGVSDSLDVEIHPGWAIIAPHIAVKTSHGDLGTWKLASRHQLGYPTPLLRGLARGGTGGVLAPDSVIPATVVLQNEVFFGKTEGDTEMSIALGASFAAEIGDSEYSTIDYAYGFRQTNLYQNDVSIHIAAGSESFLTDTLGYRTWTKGWFYPTAEEKWVLEERTSVLWQASERSQASVGVNFSYAQYPWGVQWHAFPAADWVWAW